MRFLRVCLCDAVVCASTRGRWESPPVPVLIDALRVAEQLQQLDSTRAHSTSVGVSSASIGSTSIGNTISHEPLAPVHNNEVDVAAVRARVFNLDDASLAKETKDAAFELLNSCFPLRGNKEVLNALIYKKVAESDRTYAPCALHASDRSASTIRGPSSITSFGPSILVWPS
jgi:hypothetical protein